jgi:hypothetical protein
MSWGIFRCTVAFLLLTAAPAFGCSGRLESVTKAIAADYDPFSPVEQRERYDIKVRNTGSETCNYLVGFVQASAMARLGGLLPYSLQDASGRDLLSDAITARRAAHSPGTIAGGNTAVIPVYLTVPRGHFAGPGLYKDAISMVLYGSKNRREADSDPIDQRGFSVERQVGACVSVNTAGGGLVTTVDFGELVDGHERFVIVQTRTNQVYRLEITSQNGGHLTLDPPVPGEDWRVKYSVRIDGVAVNLEAVASVLEDELSPNGDRSHKLTFRITDAGKKRAGRYRDIITVKIAARV